MTKHRKGKLWSRRLLVISVSSVLLLLLSGGLLLIKQTLRMANYKAEILQVLQGTLHRRVIYESGDFSFRVGPSFTFKKIAIMEKDGSATFFTADRLTFKLALLPLLEKKLVLRGVVLDEPSITVVRDPSGSLNISDLLGETEQKAPLQVSGVRVKNGTLRMIDRGTGRNELTTVLAKIDCSLSRHFQRKGSSLRFSSTVLQGAETADIRIHGSVTPAPGGHPLTETSFDGVIEVKNLVAGHFWDYYSRYVPFKKVEGRLEIDARFKGTVKDFSSKGTVRLSGLRFDYFPIFHAVLTPKSVSFSYKMELNPRDITVKSLDLNVDALHVRGSCALKDIPSGDLFIDARAVIDPFRLEDFRNYIPYGIIADDASRYIEQHIMGGTYRLEQGSLIGRVSQIAHMEKGTNYNVLFIKGTVDQGLVSYGPDVPTFNNIKGHLEMRGKDFILSGMEAKFGSSPFTLDGRITDYPLTTPCNYPFTAVFQPRPAEIAWLLRQQKSKQFGFSGESLLSLQGSGPSSGYSLTGSWDLSAAAYSYRDLIAKSSGLANHLSFKTLVTETGAQVSAFKYDLMPLVLAGSAEYRPDAKRPLSFTIRTNDFQVQPLASQFPKLARLQPSGKLHLSLQGSAGGNEENSPLLDGNLAVREGSCRLSETMKPLSSINGTLVFQGNSVKTSRVTARIGKSALAGNGTLTGFAEPEVSFELSSPAFDLTDLGLRSPGKQVIVRQLHGAGAIKENSLTIKSLAGLVNRSNVRVSGSVNDLRSPRANIELSAPYLDMDDVALLAGLERETGEVRPVRMSLHAVVNAEEGKFHQVEFRKLRSVVNFEQKILYVEQADCEVLDGTFSGTGRVDFGITGGPRYQTTFSLQKIAAGQFLQALGTTRELTGTMSLEGNLTAKGNTIDEITATSLGHIRLHCEKGTLRKFSLLSKLFSVLNVSQLFKFKLPDMVSGGMPYNEINAGFSLRDGIVATDDLFIDSNAMNISIVGDFNLVKKEMNVTVGVKPLQTVDKIVSRIPVIGWVLTGKNKSLITTYFEATGSLDNPTIKSITAKSMAKGIFSIFKRLFSLPAKLVTDTGEVIINQ